MHTDVVDEVTVTSSPEFEYAFIRIFVAEKLLDDAPMLNVIACGPCVIMKSLVTGTASENSRFPDWLAVTVQVPTDIIWTSP